MRRADIVARLERAVEALTDGEQSLALQLVEDLRRELENETRRLSHRCDRCGQMFEWPGLLDHHLRFSSCGPSSRWAA